jgi:hypothetical protein
MLNMSQGIAKTRVVRDSTTGLQKVNGGVLQFFQLANIVKLARLIWQDDIQPVAPRAEFTLAAEETREVVVLNLTI